MRGQNKKGAGIGSDALIISPPLDFERRGSEAAEIFRDMIASNDFVELLTLPAYELLG